VIEHGTKVSIEITLLTHIIASPLCANQVQIFCNKHSVGAACVRCADRACANNLAQDHELSTRPDDEFNTVPHDAEHKLQSTSYVGKASTLPQKFDTQSCLTANLQLPAPRGAVLSLFYVHPRLHMVQCHSQLRVLHIHGLLHAGDDNVFSGALTKV
jgi:hypothetical protein